MNKFSFEACYPMQSSLYFNSRFQLEGLKPHQITVSEPFNRKLTFPYKDGLKLIQEQYLPNCQIISMYSFEITTDNILIEKFDLRNAHFKVYTQLDESDIITFFHYIFPLQGVLLFGNFDSKEHFLVRDEVCCKFAHEIYPKHTDFLATWWEDEPYINHFFVFPKSEREHIHHFVAIGGNPLDFAYGEKNNTTATFYLMKGIRRNHEKAYIKETDNMQQIEEFEKEIVKQTIEGIEKEGIDYQIYYSVRLD
jgi:hypothetical protein